VGTNQTDKELKEKEERRDQIFEAVERLFYRKHRYGKRHLRVLALIDMSAAAIRAGDFESSRKYSREVRRIQPERTKENLIYDCGLYAQCLEEIKDRLGAVPDETWPEEYR
jgi:hypothetical protein